MKDIFAIGPSQSVLLFQGIGITSYIINTKEELEVKIEKLASYAKIIFISESLSPLISDFVKQYNELVYPIILFIPLEGQESSMGVDNLKKEVEKAIGMAIL